MTDVADISLDTILAKLRELAPAIKAEGVTRLAVFGSRARGDARPDSDLDILIETFDRSDGTRRFDWSKVMNMIEDSIGVWPHLMFSSELTPRIKERMADDLIEVL
jgi:predicted nucleotidyltransferase